MGAELDEESGSALQSISRGASLFFVGRAFSRAANFLFNLVLTRFLGATLFGVFAYAQTIVSVFSIVALLGTGESLLRFLPEHEGDAARRNWVVSLAYLTSLVASVAIAAVVFATAPIVSAHTLEDPLLVDVMRVLALVLPLNTLSNLTSDAFRALELPEYQVFLEDVLEPGTRFAFVAIALALGYRLLGAVAAIAAASVVLFVAAIVLLGRRTDLSPGGERSTGSVRRFYDYSVPLTLKDLGRKLYTRADIVMVGFFLTGQAVGIYRVSILLTGLLTLPLMAINQLFPPVASGLYSDGEFDRLESVYTVCTRWIFTAVLPLSLFLVVFRTPVLGVFGPEFTGGATVLLLFALANLANCAVGPAGYLLTMTDHQYLNLADQWLLGVANVVLNYVLLLEYGFLGAAIATATTVAAINVLQAVQVWYLEGLSPYGLNFWKPIVAGGVAGAVMYGASLATSGLVGAAAGSALGLLAFAATIYALGIDQRDREFFAEHVDLGVGS